MVTESKYAAIVTELREDLRHHRAGDRFLSEHQVALRFAVSRPTAARALSELCRERLLERRVGSGTFVAAVGREAGGAPVRSVGLLLSGLGSTEVWDPLSTQITRACSSHGISVRMGPQAAPQDDVASTVAQAEDLIEQGVDGVLFAPLESVEDRESANISISEMFTAAGIPVVLVDRDIVDFPQRSSFDIVGVDNVRGAAQIGRHLAETGRRRPVFFSRPHHPSTTDLRVAGCAAALAAGGVPAPPDWHVSGDPADAGLIRTMLTTQRPDVIVASNDRTAAILIQTLTRLGKVVPDDLAVTGFDNVVYSTLLAVSLTTVAQPFEAIARVAVRVLLDRVADPEAEPRETLLPAALVVRESSSPPHNYL